MPNPVDKSQITITICKLKFTIQNRHYNMKYILPIGILEHSSVTQKSGFLKRRRSLNEFYGGIRT